MMPAIAAFLQMRTCTVNVFVRRFQHEIRSIIIHSVMSKSTEKKNTYLFRLLESENPNSCSRMSPMTGEELGILADLRNLKKQAREIKSRLAEILPDWKHRLDESEAGTLSNEVKSHIRDLEQLREKWKEREDAWEQARHRRMIALGYEDP